MRCVFASDLHGSERKYSSLFTLLRQQPVDALFLGGDILPSGLFFFSHRETGIPDFLEHCFFSPLESLKTELGAAFPEVFVILGNDDLRIYEQFFFHAEERGLLRYMHNRGFNWRGFKIFGYSCVPPTPFMLKDWERYDISRYVDPNCTLESAGIRSVAISPQELEHTTIADELAALAGEDCCERAIFLFHTPPYNTKLDMLDTRGAKVDYVHIDPHVGSMAVRSLIEQRQPLITLHGHIHESSRVSGSWKDTIGNTRMFSAAHEGRQLCLIEFDPDRPDVADKILID